MLKIILPKALNVDTSDSSTFLSTFNLNEYIEWTTNVASCGASNISVCADQTCTSFGSDSRFYMAANPTNKDDQGFVSP